MGLAGLKLDNSTKAIGSVPLTDIAELQTQMSGDSSSFAT